VIGYRGESAKALMGQLPLTAARSDPGMVRARGACPVDQITPEPPEEQLPLCQPCYLPWPSDAQ
jgi:hypothetical protein